MRRMDERALAEIEAEMNDPDAWGEPEDAPPPAPDMTGAPPATRGSEGR